MKKLICVLALLSFLPALLWGAGAETESNASKASYPLLIRDELHLLNEQEIQSLQQAMEPLTACCAAAFWTTDEQARDVGNQAIAFCENNIHRGRDYPCVLFLIIAVVSVIGLRLMNGKEED